MWTDCDADGVPDMTDNCPGVPNPTQDASACATAVANCATINAGQTSDLSNADLRGCTISAVPQPSRLNLRGADLSCATLSGGFGGEGPVVDLTGAKMHRFSFNGIWVGGATFDQADMSEMMFTGQLLAESSFRGTNLSGAYIQGIFFVDLPADGLAVADAGTDAARDGAASAEAGPSTDSGSGAMTYPPIDFTGANLSGAYICGIWNGAELINATVGGMVCGAVSACRGGTTGASPTCVIPTVCP
jgi:uncharacterized protein YjbI with pentapeptide repeats